MHRRSKRPHAGLGFILAITCIVGAASGMTACKPRAKVDGHDAGAGRSADRDTHVVTSDDGRIALTVPTGWTTAKARRSESIRVDNGKVYVTVDSYEREDLTADTLDAFMKFVTEPFGELEGATGCVPQQLDLADRHGLRCEMRGAKDGYNYTYLLTAIEAEESWHLVTAMGMQSRYRGSRAQLEAISNSITVTSKVSKHP